MEVAGRWQQPGWAPPPESSPLTPPRWAPRVPGCGSFKNSTQQGGSPLKTVSMGAPSQHAPSPDLVCVPGRGLWALAARLVDVCHPG